MWSNDSVVDAEQSFQFVYKYPQQCTLLYPQNEVSWDTMVLVETVTSKIDTMMVPFLNIPVIYRLNYGTIDLEMTFQGHIPLKWLLLNIGARNDDGFFCRDTSKDLQCQITPLRSRFFKWL